MGNFLISKRETALLPVLLLLLLVDLFSSSSNNSSSVKSGKRCGERKKIKEKKRKIYKYTCMYKV